MKAPRFQNRRDFNVASAGWFSVLKTAPRTVSLRPPGGYRSLAGQSRAADTSTASAELLADRLRTTRIPLIGDAGMIDRGLVRMALIVFSAASLTLFILWWMIGFRH